MEKRLSQLMVLKLDYFELAAFQYYLGSSSLPPVNMKDILYSNEGKIKCVISIPTNIEAEMMEELWREWKELCFENEYAVLN